MTKEQAVAHFTNDGEAPYQGVKRLAALLHVSVSSVYQWPEDLGGRFFLHQCAIEVLTGGSLKADRNSWINAEGCAA